MQLNLFSHMYMYFSIAIHTIYVCITLYTITGHIWMLQLQYILYTIALHYAPSFVTFGDGTFSIWLHWLWWSFISWHLKLFHLSWHLLACKQPGVASVVYCQMTRLPYSWQSHITIYIMFVWHFLVHASHHKFEKKVPALSLRRLMWCLKKIGRSTI